MTAQFKDYLNKSLVAYEIYLEKKGYKGNAMLTMMNDAVRFAYFLAGRDFDKNKKIGRRLPD